MKMSSGLIAQASLNIFDHYKTFVERFGTITARAALHFARCDWISAQQAAVDRIDVYKDVVDETVKETVRMLGSSALDSAVWSGMKQSFQERVIRRGDFKVAGTFFNSITRRVLGTVGVQPSIEFTAVDFPGDGSIVDSNLTIGFGVSGNSWIGVYRQIFSTFQFDSPYEDLERDVRAAAAETERGLGGGFACERVDVMKAVFYRGRRAYVVGRIQCANHTIPLVVCFSNGARGVFLEALLVENDDVSILFGFAHSYFHVDVDNPVEAVRFLKSIMPWKRTAELYIALGYNKHGKTELYRDLMRHLRESDDTFVTAQGEKGMVMTVFTLPAFDMVFKVIRDRFAEPKNATREDVMDKYKLVFRHDRAGRLVDAQEFEHLQFDRSRFSEDLVRELLETAPKTVSVDDRHVSIRHLYTERRMIPLDVYVREADETMALHATLEYGQALKDLAAANIFSGDILLKNFGVTRHGRVISYDYDELCLLTDCNFRIIPEDNGAGSEEAGFYVGPRDIFPEQFRIFLGLPDTLGKAFQAAHGDLFSIGFWHAMQDLHRSDVLPDIKPFRRSKILRSPL